MNVLSLFDGVACGRVALERCGVKIEKYYSSEIDKYASMVVRKLYPDTIELGDVKTVSKDRIDCQIDLIMGGSPCQDLSVAKKDRAGLAGNRSGLFYEYVRLLKELQPKYFLLENVASMKKEDRDIISKELGVEPILINSSLVSAQQRKRLYWTNIKIEGLPLDKGIVLKDILESGVATNIINQNEIKKVVEKSHCIMARDYKGFGNQEMTGVAEIISSPERIGQLSNGGQADRVYSVRGKSVCLSANGGGGGAKTGLYLVADNGKEIDLNGFKISPFCLKEVRTELGKKLRAETRKLNGTDTTLRNKDCKKYIPKDDNKANCLTTTASVEHNIIDIDEEALTIRKLTPIECERLQTLPDNHTALGIDEKGKEVKISNTQRYKMCGNGWTVDVIAWIFGFIGNK